MGKIIVKSVRIDKDVNDRMADIADSFGVSQNDLLNTILKLYLNIPTLENKILDKNPTIKMFTKFPLGVEVKEPKKVGVIGGAVVPKLVEIDKMVERDPPKNDGVNDGPTDGVSDGINVFGNTVVTIQEPNEDDED